MAYFVPCRSATVANGAHNGMSHSDAISFLISQSGCP